jgi:hypothetical protein
VLHLFGRCKHANKKPTDNVALEEPLYAIVKELARIKGLSMSMVTRELIKEAIEIEENTLLVSFAEERDKSLTKC